MKQIQQIKNQVRKQIRNPNKERNTTMSNFNDYHAYRSTTDRRGSCGSGGSGSFFLKLLVVIGLLLLIAECTG